jgi:hypothetical protein
VLIITILKSELTKNLTYGTVWWFFTQHLGLNKYIWIDFIDGINYLLTSENLQSLVFLSIKTMASRIFLPSTVTNSLSSFFHRVMIAMTDLLGPHRIRAPRPRTPVRPNGFLSWNQLISVAILKEKKMLLWTYNGTSSWVSNG